MCLCLCLCSVRDLIPISQTKGKLDEVMGQHKTKILGQLQPDEVCQFLSDLQENKEGLSVVSVLKKASGALPGVKYVTLANANRELTGFVVMTARQRERLRTYGQVISVDGTYNTSKVRAPFAQGWEGRFFSVLPTTAASAEWMDRVLSLHPGRIWSCLQHCLCSAQERTQRRRAERPPEKHCQVGMPGG